jgi:hypothetical protein
MLRSRMKAPLSVEESRHNAARGDWRALISIKLATVTRTKGVWITQLREGAYARARAR